jgi:hypothetical protein
MDLLSFLYLVDVLDGIRVMLAFVVILAMLASLFLCMHGYFEVDMNALVLAKKTAIAAAILWAIATLIPSEKTLYMMAGAHVVHEVAQTDSGKTAIKIVEMKLQQYADELANEMTKEK